MQAIHPFLMFEGRAEEAMNFYVSLFGGKVVQVDRYGAEGPGPVGTIKLAKFSVGALTLLASDSFVKHGFTFTPSLSLFVDFGSEEELRKVYGALAEGGSALMPLGDYGFSRQFGWVNDRFGVSWQLNLPAR